MKTEYKINFENLKFKDIEILEMEKCYFVVPTKRYDINRETETLEKLSSDVKIHLTDEEENEIYFFIKFLFEMDWESCRIINVERFDFEKTNVDFYLLSRPDENVKILSYSLSELDEMLFHQVLDGILDKVIEKFNSKILYSAILIPLRLHYLLNQTPDKMKEKIKSHMLNYCLESQQLLKNLRDRIQIELEEE